MRLLQSFPRATALALLVLLTSGAAALPLAQPDAVGARDALQRDLLLCADDACRVTAATRASDDVAALLRSASGPADALADALVLQGVSATMAPARATTLERAILSLYDAARVPVDATLRADVARQAASAPRDLAPSLAALVQATADAHRAGERILAPADRALLAQDLRLAMLRVTFREGEAPVLDALARADLAQAAPAALRLALAAESLGGAYSACERVLDLPFVQVGGACDDTYTATNLVQVDYGGDDTYLNNAGAGIAGVGAGVSVDRGAGRDTYRAAGSAQGFGLGGIGLLLDEGGSDLYNLTQFGQGFAVAGFGLLYDAGDGDDVYESAADPGTIGTKAGGLGGVGVLVDEGGNDRYQQDGLDGFVYGAAGGLGLLVDQGDGADEYVSRDTYIELLGTPIGDIVGPIQVSAEVHATAILYEEGGDDRYQCGGHVRQGCQGAGGVGGFALLLDLAGNDRYALGESVSPVQLGLLPVFPSGQGVAYGEGSAPPGAGVGVLRDVTGDDVYVASAFAQGYATGGLGLLLDEAGADAYGPALAPPLAGARGDGQSWADGLALGLGIDRS